MQRIKITDLLLEVDRWTGFSECFSEWTRLRSYLKPSPRLCTLKSLEKRDIVQPVFDLFQAHLSAKRSIRWLVRGQNACEHLVALDTILDLFN
jgi:hypothetical protein